MYNRLTFLIFVFMSSLPKENQRVNTKYPTAKQSKRAMPNPDSDYSKSLCRLVAAVTMVNGRGNIEPMTVSVPCFCKDNDEACQGDVMVSIEEKGIIEWYCELCEAEGEIDSWQEGFFDCSDFKAAAVH